MSSLENNDYKFFLKTSIQTNKYDKCAPLDLKSLNDFFLVISNSICEPVLVELCIWYVCWYDFNRKYGKNLEKKILCVVSHHMVLRYANIPALYDYVTFHNWFDVWFILKTTQNAYWSKKKLSYVVFTK